MSERRSAPAADEISLDFEPEGLVRLACGGVFFVELGRMPTDELLEGALCVSTIRGLPETGTAKAVSLLGCFPPPAVNLAFMVFHSLNDLYS